MRFEVHPSHVDEHVPADTPASRVVESLAMRKAYDVAHRFPRALTLGADTVVELSGDLLGKPADPAEAAEMLRRLAGRTHVVHTGIALLHPASNRTACTSERTRVTMYDMDAEEIAAYVASGSPMDKAGAYGIQDDGGSLFVERIEGDYYTVVGLPLHRLYRTLREHFQDILIKEHPAHA